MSRDQQPTRDEWRKAQVAALIAAQELGIGSTADRCELAEFLFGRPVSTWNDLSLSELRTLRCCYKSYESILHQRRQRR